jgi:hypothetical protein
MKKGFLSNGHSVRNATHDLKRLGLNSREPSKQFCSRPVDVGIIKIVSHLLSLIATAIAIATATSAAVYFLWAIAIFKLNLLLLRLLLSLRLQLRLCISYERVQFSN